MKKVCAIISGGTFSKLRLIDYADMVIACDKGYQYAKDAGVKVDLLVGDFDSYEGALPDDVPRLDLPVEKDDTDTLAAVRYACEQGFEEIWLYCALGGRLDHLLSNFQTAAFAVEKGACVTIIDEANEVHFYTNTTLAFKRRENCSISVLSLSDKATGVTIRGAKYEVENATLTNTFPIGESNEWAREFVNVSVKTGIIAVILSQK